jgi:flavin-dependent dehydrogenase
MSEPQPHSSPAPAADYDVVVIGGAFAGAGFATLLRRFHPAARVLIVERQERFDRKVGEATVEVSALFLHRALGLYDLMSRGHLPKHGLRFWFTDRPDRGLAEMSEVGPASMPRLPAFQLDRSRLDEQLLATAAAAGCEVARPAKVTAVETGRPCSRLTVETAGGERRLTARWVVDASGRQTFLARRLGLLEPVDAHPTAALWARWRGVADLDGPAVMGGDPRRPLLPGLAVSRRLATNHFCGYGWWIWVIPLAGGETSVGLVYNKELFEPPGDGTLRQRYVDFVTSRAGLRELLAGAEIADDDFLAYRHLPYRSSRYAGPGWALVGDAAAFLDPYYSPGLDHASISAYATARLIEDDLAGAHPEDELGERLDRHNRRFALSYGRWLEALYLGKYEILGDAELTACAYLVETALYYLGVVTPVHRDIESLAHPMFGLSLPQSTAAWRLMSGFNRRLTRMARFRRSTGVYGRRNHNWRLTARPPGLGSEALGMLLQGLAAWLRAELHYLVHRIGRPGLDLSRPVPAAPPPAG